MNCSSCNHRYLYDTTPFTEKQFLANRHSLRICAVIYEATGQETAVEYQGSGSLAALSGCYNKRAIKLALMSNAVGIRSTCDHVHSSG